MHSILDRWTNVHALPKFVVTVAALLAGALVLMFPVKRAYKDWRLERMRVAALAAFEAGQMQRARESALGAVVGGSGEIEMYRVLELSMGELSDHRHLALARVVFEHEDATDQDRLRTFCLLSEVTPMGALGGMWLRLPERLREDGRFAVAFSKAQLSDGLYAEAGGVLLAVPEHARTAAVWQQLIRVMLCEGTDGVMAVAFEWLGGFWPKQVVEDDGWYEVLEEIPVEKLDTWALTAVRLKLRGEADQTPRGALALARLEWAERISQRPAVVAEAVERWKAASPGDLARFLLAVGADRELLEAVSDEQVGADRELLLNLLVAARRAADWERFEQLVTVHAGLLADWERAAHRAVMLVGKGEAVEESKEVRDALKEAELSRDDRAFIGQQEIFAAAGLKVAAELARLEAMLRGRGPLPLYQEIRPITDELMAKKRDDMLLRIYRNYLDFEPSEPQLAARFLYLGLLRKLFSPEMAAERLELIGESHPDDREIPHYLAAAWLSAGMPAAAARALEQSDPIHFSRRVLDLDWEAAKALEIIDPIAVKVPPRLRAIRLATRVANGGLAVDDPRVASFPIGDLLAMEAREFREWLELARDE